MFNLDPRSRSPFFTISVRPAWADSRASMSYLLAVPEPDDPTLDDSFLVRGLPGSHAEEGYGLRIAFKDSVFGRARSMPGSISIATRNHCLGSWLDPPAVLTSTPSTLPFFLCYFSSSPFWPFSCLLVLDSLLVSADCPGDIGLFNCCGFSVDVLPNLAIFLSWLLGDSPPRWSSTTL
jgi:hypothetical protein